MKEYDLNIVLHTGKKVNEAFRQKWQSQLTTNNAQLKNAKPTK